ncbi:uncharacterized protein BDR25DRAFT_229129, partial [Lindgomyces ingoldianus]
LLVNGTESAKWQYVRDVATMGSNPNELYKLWPQYSGDEMYQPSITCGRKAIDSANKTQTADIIAGDQVGFRVANIPIFHGGPTQIYMSKVPEGKTLADYAGDGDWFKIASAGAASDTAWKLASITIKEYNFTIPRTTPPGKYLLRIEQMWPLPGLGSAQFYVNCAHVNVMGPGGAGTPTEFAKFPGTYDLMDPGTQPYISNLPMGC